MDVLLGLQWGDEGKGKVVDYLALLMKWWPGFREAQMPVIPWSLTESNMCYTKYPAVFSEKISTILLEMVWYLIPWY